MIRTRNAMIRILVTAVLAGLVCRGIGQAAHSASLTLAHLETNAAPQSLGIDDPTPRLSWAIVSGRRGVVQTAYRVLVASKHELAREGKADIWDSEQITSSTSRTGAGSMKSAPVIINFASPIKARRANSEREKNVWSS